MSQSCDQVLFEMFWSGLSVLHRCQILQQQQKLLKKNITLIFVILNKCPVNFIPIEIYWDSFHVIWPSVPFHWNIITFCSSEYYNLENGNSNGKCFVYWIVKLNMLYYVLPIIF